MSEPTPDKPEYWQRRVRVGTDAYIYELDLDKVSAFLAELWKDKEKRRKANLALMDLS